MLRREVVKMAGSLFGLGAGTPSRFPYPDRPQPAPGVGPSNAQTFRQVIVKGANGGVFVYDAATGLLIGSISNAATDPVNRGTVLPVITAYSTQNGSYVQLLPGTAGAGAASLNIGSGDSAEGVPLKVLSQVSGAGATRRIVTTMRAPRVTGEGVSAASSILLFSESADLSLPALLNLVVTDDAGANTSSYNQTPTGFTFNNKPITDFNGDQLTAAQADATLFNLTNPVAATAITDAWTIPANDAKVGSTYCIEVPFDGVWQASGNLNFEYDLNGTSTNLVPVAAGLAAAGQNYGGVLRLYLQAITTGAGGTCNIWSDGDAANTSVARVGGSSAPLFGVTTGHAFNTTVANTLAVSVVFSVGNAGQTINGRGSTFSRAGQ